jgi:hypothetical protein
LTAQAIKGSYLLSTFTTASVGSLKIKRGRAKLIVTFLNTLAFFPNIYLIISRPTAPTIVAVVVEIAGIILPAMSLILKLSASSI